MASVALILACVVVVVAASPFPALQTLAKDNTTVNDIINPSYDSVQASTESDMSITTEIPNEELINELLVSASHDNEINDHTNKPDDALDTKSDVEIEEIRIAENNEKLESETKILKHEPTFGVTQEKTNGIRIPIEDTDTQNQTTVVIEEQPILILDEPILSDDMSEDIKTRVHPSRSDLIPVEGPELEFQIPDSDSPFNFKPQEMDNTPIEVEAEVSIDHSTPLVGLPLSGIKPIQPVAQFDLESDRLGSENDNEQFNVQLNDMSLIPQMSWDQDMPDNHFLFNEDKDSLISSRPLLGFQNGEVVIVVTEDDTLDQKDIFEPINKFKNSYHEDDIRNKGSLDMLPELSGVIKHITSLINVPLFSPSPDKQITPEYEQTYLYYFPGSKDDDNTEFSRHTPIENSQEIPLNPRFQSPPQLRPLVQSWFQQNLNRPHRFNNFDLGQPQEFSEFPERMAPGFNVQTLNNPQSFSDFQLQFQPNLDIQPLASPNIRNQPQLVPNVVYTPEFFQPSLKKQDQSVLYQSDTDGKVDNTKQLMIQTPNRQEVIVELPSERDGFQQVVICNENAKINNIVGYTENCSNKREDGIAHQNDEILSADQKIINIDNVEQNKPDENIVSNNYDVQGNFKDDSISNTNELNILSQVNSNNDPDMGKYGMEVLRNQDTSNDLNAYDEPNMFKNNAEVPFQFLKGNDFTGPNINGQLNNYEMTLSNPDALVNRESINFLKQYISILEQQNINLSQLHHFNSRFYSPYPRTPSNYNSAYVQQINANENFSPNAAFPQHNTYRQREFYPNGYGQVYPKIYMQPNYNYMKPQSLFNSADY